MLSKISFRGNLKFLPEWNWSIGIQLAADIVDVELEVGDVHEARVLMNVEHVRIQSRKMENILGESG